VHLWQRRGWHWREPKVLTVIVVASVAVSAIGVWAALAARAELSILFSNKQRWAAPALDIPGVTLTMGHEALMAGIVGTLWILVALLWIWVSKATYGPRSVADHASLFHRVVTTTLAVFGIFLALPWLDAGNPQGLTFRLRIVGFVPLALVASVLLVHFAGAVTPHRRVRSLGLIACSIAMFWLAPARLTQGVIRAHPAMVSAVQALHDEIPLGKTVIVPERHIAFMVHWYTRAPTRLRPETVQVNQRVRLVTLSFIGAGSALEHTIDRARNTPGVTPPLGVHPMHRNGLVLIEEDTWQWILNQLPDNLRARPAKWPVI
jgi:hypothetical protein